MYMVEIIQPSLQVNYRPWINGTLITPHIYTEPPMPCSFYTVNLILNSSLVFLRRIYCIPSVSIREYSFITKQHFLPVRKTQIAFSVPNSLPSRNTASRLVILSSSFNSRNRKFFNKVILFLN